MKLDDTPTNEPFDGVLPSDYPNEYDHLLESRCCRQTPDTPRWFQEIGEDRNTCGACYQKSPFEAREVIYFHGTRLTRYSRLNCETCGVALLEVRPVIECGDCTDRCLW